MTDEFVLEPAKRLAGSLRVPGDKAISHRALLIGSGCERGVSVTGLSTAADVRSSYRICRQLSSEPHSQAPKSLLESFPNSSETQPSLKLEGTAGWQGWARRGMLECENSGTTMRLLMGILAGVAGEYTLTGDPSLTARPMGRVAEPLRRMGARVRLSDAGTPPVVIRGGDLEGIRYEMPVASAQVKTAVLLAGLSASSATTVVEGVTTRDHTERLLSYLGAPVSTNGREIGIEPLHLFGDKEINIPGDFSSASFLLTAAALHPQGDVTIEDVGLNPTRTAFLDVLRRFGARVETGDVEERCGEPRGWVRVRSGDRRPVWVAPEEIASCIDELPLVAVLAGLAEGESEVRGAAELRVKESDRIAAMTAGLSAMGVDITALPDGFAVRGRGSVRGAHVASGGDHRIAMALAVAACVADGPTRISGWAAVGVSYPEFPGDLAALTR